jgi:hypothetical protein
MMRLFIDRLFYNEVFFITGIKNIHEWRWPHQARLTADLTLFFTP